MKLVKNYNKKEVDIMRVIQLNNGETVYIDSFDSAINIISEKFSYELGEFLKQRIDNIIDENIWFENENREIKDGVEAANTLVDRICSELQKSETINKLDLLSDIMEISEKLKR